MVECPYTGLMPFSEEQAPFFFGRESEREIIIANMMASRLTLLYGPSGVGKTSVLNAGVAHHLRATAADARARRGSADFAVVVFRAWRDDPVESLGRAIDETVVHRATGATFADRLRAWAAAIDGDLLIVLDQFEEFFLYHGAEDGDGSFAVEFPRAVNRPDLRVSFLVSMREDSIAKLDFFKGRIHNLFDNRLRIDHLAIDQARDAIVKPLEVFNRMHAADGVRMDIEDALVDRVLQQVAAGRVSFTETGTGRVAGGSGAQRHIETPYLQLVMTRLWQKETEARSRVLRASTLEELGGAGRIVATHLDDALNALGDDERALAAELFQRLVTPARTKIALSVDDLAGYAGRDAAQVRALLVRLSSGLNRILVPVAPAPDQPSGERYQIFHDVLAAAVLDWRRKYIELAKQKEAEALAEQERRKAEKEARDAARLRRMLALVVLLLVATIAAVGFAWWQTKRTESVRRNLVSQVAAAQADAREQAEKARALEVRADDNRKVVYEQRARVLELQAQAAAAANSGKVDQARKYTADATTASNRASEAQRTADRLSGEAAQARQMSEARLSQAEQLLKQTGEARPAETLPQPTVVAPPPIVTPPPPQGPPQQTTVPGADSKAPDNSNRGGGSPPSVQAVGDYKEIYRRAIDAKNRRRWPEAAQLFQAAIQANPKDTAERINISGFGNIEPYLPQYYLGLALKNTGDCAGALRAWEASESAGAIQRTKLYADLQQNRRECLAR